MKIRWKRINWGVLFALVLIAGLVIYLIVDNAKFKQSKSEIMETAERYLQEQPLAEKKDQEAAMLWKNCLISIGRK